MEDLIGLRSGRLTVIDYDGVKYSGKRNRIYLKCSCECGNIVSVRIDGITSGRTKSCGCLQREKTSKRMKNLWKQNPIGSQNNESRERLHNIWYLMKHRCENKNSVARKNYMDRGIKVCDEWSDSKTGYFAFKEWAYANGYSENLTIDRIDNNGNYEPSNCRWANAFEQANNKRDNVVLTYNGETKTAAQWARDAGASYKAFINRIEHGWDIERAIKQPYRKSRMSLTNENAN